jgi:hypothetical protein
LREVEEFSSSPLFDMVVDLDPRRGIGRCLRDWPTHSA